MQEEIQPEQFPDSENDNNDGLLGKLVNCTGGNGDRRDFKILGSRIGFNVTANVDFHEPLVMLCSMSALGEFNPSEVPYRPVQERAWTSLGPRRPTWLTAGPNRSPKKIEKT